MRGFSVFTRPSRISGKPVYSSIARMSIPWSRSSRAVPPVETISTPSSARPRAKSTRPRLSDTVSSARRTWTSPGRITAALPPLVVAISFLLEEHAPSAGGIELHAPAREHAHGLRQEAVLDLVDPFLNGGDVGRIAMEGEGLLGDDRARVDALVDEVDRDPGDLNPVLQGLLHRPQPGERRQQRRVDVDHPASEAPHEVVRQDLHESGQDDQVDPLRLEPVAQQRIALAPRGELVGHEHPGLYPGLTRSLERRRVRPVRGDRHDLDPLAPVDRVEQGLEVRPLSGDHDRDAVAHGPARRTGYGPSVVASRLASISSSIRPRMSARRMCADVPYAGSPSYALRSIFF